MNMQFMESYTDSRTRSGKEDGVGTKRDWTPFCDEDCSYSLGQFQWPNYL